MECVRGVGMCLYTPLCKQHIYNFIWGAQGQYTYKLSQQQARAKAKNVPSALPKSVAYFYAPA